MSSPTDPDVGGGGDERPRHDGQVYDGLTVRLVPAPVGKRILAYATDLGIVGALMYGFGLAAFFVFGGIGALTWLARGKTMGRAEIIAYGGIVVLVLLAMLAVYHGYFVYHESRTGTTPGKRLFGLRVVSADGRKLSVGQCVQRDLMRLIDCAMVLPGSVALAMTSPRRRLGDMVAGTLVVHSPMQETRQDYLYMRQEDYLLYKERLRPPPVALGDCQTYLASAFGVFVRRQPPTAAGLQAMDALLDRHLPPPAAAGVAHDALRLFFAEHCNQCLLATKRSS